tara:strand:- start:10836 stop:11807 length:972 start_codon:yes stop_codon:yes gene_type:complete
MVTDIHFVVGIWRSGTTMLREVLEMSEEVKTLPEHFVLLNNLSRAKIFSSIEKAKMLNSTLENNDFLHFAKPNVEQLKTKFSTATTFEEAINAIYSSCLRGNEIPSILIDKNPIYSYYLPQLLVLFPNAKFIWMLREPKDNCISRAKHKIQHFENYNYLASWWNHTNDLIAQQAKKYPDRFLLVHYDAMCEAPEAYTKKICNFLGVKFDAEMLNFRKHKEEKQKNYLASLEARDGKLDPEYLKQKYAMWENLQKPINTSKINQWEKELTLNQIAQVDSLSKEYYENLIKGQFNSSPKRAILWDSLIQISLGKLKFDIRRNIKS